MKVRLALALALLMPPNWAGAATWSAVMASEKMRAEIDIASIMRQGNIVTAWDREVYSQPEQAKPGDFYFKSSKSLVRYSCDLRTADLLMRVYYAEDGSEIKTITASYYGRPSYVIPDTDGEQKFEYACKYRKSAEKKAAPIARKKAAKPKGAEKAAEPSAKEVPAAKKAEAKVKPAAPEGPAKQFPRLAPVLKPSGVLPKPPAEDSKGRAPK